MAFKTLASMKYILVFIVLSSFSQYLISARPLRSHHNVSSLKFLEHLQGNNLGEYINGLNDLKIYLKKYGYLKDNDTHVDHDELDDSLEAAIKTYQLNFNLKPTGALDSHTVSRMIKPRCGVADIVNGRTRMQSNTKGHRLHTTSHYSFFEESPRWPKESKYNLTYAFGSNAPLKLRPAIISALQTWASVSLFKFTEVQDFESANIKIEFFVGDHGDGSPFDGPNGELGHAYAPTYGALHFDAEEAWAIGDVDKESTDMKSVALHELGHILGLDHSSVKEAIMYPSIEPGEIKSLQDDDIQGLKTLYKQQ